MKYIVYVVAGIILLYLVFPIFIIIPMAFNSSPFLIFPPHGFSTQWFTQVIQDPNWVNGFKNSVIVAVSTTIISVILGTSAAFGLINVNPKIRGMVFGFLMLPIVVPLVIIAIALYNVFSDLGLVGTYAALIMSHTIIAVPYVI